MSAGETQKRGQVLTHYIFSWLEAKRADDNVEDGLWRIQNTLYDLTDFIHVHPGGADWIELTRGQDITELFFTHHVFLGKTAIYLEKYRVRDTDKPRNSKLQFEESGFYMTLKRRAEKQIKQLDGKRFLTKVSIKSASRWQVRVLTGVYFSSTSTGCLS